jgi:c(7)-type cytochrome triheme protein
MKWSAARWLERSLAAAACRAAVAAAVLMATVVLMAAAAGKPPEIRLPRDIVYARSKDTPGPVVFSHAIHVEIAGNTCTGCHPAPFRMLKPVGRTTHDEMAAGRSCGVCHDGKTATGVQDDCEHCHRTAPPAAAKGGGS